MFNSINYRYKNISHNFQGLNADISCLLKKVDPIEPKSKYFQDYVLLITIIVKNLEGILILLDRKLFAQAKILIRVTYEAILKLSMLILYPDLVKYWEIQSDIAYFKEIYDFINEPAFKHILEEKALLNVVRSFSTNTFEYLKKVKNLPENLQDIASLSQHNQKQVLNKIRSINKVKFGSDLNRNFDIETINNIIILLEKSAPLDWKQNLEVLKVMKQRYYDEYSRIVHLHKSKVLNECLSDIHKNYYESFNEIFQVYQLTVVELIYWLNKIFTYDKNLEVNIYKSLQETYFLINPFFKIRIYFSDIIIIDIYKWIKNKIIN